MKKRVLALILASVITLTNGNIAFAAEADNENTTDTMVMEEAVGESTQPKPEEVTESEEQEKVTESEEQEEVAEVDPAENEEETATNTVTAEKMKENMDTTTSEARKTSLWKHRKMYRSRAMLQVVLMAKISHGLSIIPEVY